MEHVYDQSDHLSHTISEATPGMEVLMKEYLAYKRGWLSDTVHYVNGEKLQLV